MRNNIEITNMHINERTNNPFPTNDTTPTQRQPSGVDGMTVLEARQQELDALVERLLSENRMLQGMLDHVVVDERGCAAVGGE